MDSVFLAAALAASACACASTGRGRGDHALVVLLVELCLEARNLVVDRAHLVRNVFRRVIAGGSDRSLDVRNGLLGRFHLVRAACGDERHDGERDKTLQPLFRFHCVSSVWWGPYRFAGVRGSAISADLDLVRIREDVLVGFEDVHVQAAVAVKLLGDLPERVAGDDFVPLRVLVVCRCRAAGVVGAAAVPASRRRGCRGAPGEAQLGVDVGVFLLFHGQLRVLEGRVMLRVPARPRPCTGVESSAAATTPTTTSPCRDASVSDGQVPAAVRETARGRSARGGAVREPTEARIDDLALGPHRGYLGRLAATH
jgi:hypothetical protein